MADPNEIPTPSGAVNLDDPFYIEREADVRLKRQITKFGDTTTIRAPRQTGKTSLLMRGINHAIEQGYNICYLDFQNFDSDKMISFPLFLQTVVENVCNDLNLDSHIDNSTPYGKFDVTKFMERQVLGNFDQPIVLAIDEADLLLQTDFYTDFFAMLRFWHNLRSHPLRNKLWKKFNLILVISTQPYLLIRRIEQSPFNVGLILELPDFSEQQVRELNRRYGLSIEESNISNLMALLNGHPFLTRWAFYTLATKNISWNELEAVAASDRSPFGDHLRHQYWIIRNQPDLQKALKDIISTNNSSDEMALYRLLRAGLIKGSGDSYTYRCNLYKRYFMKKLLRK